VLNLSLNMPPDKLGMLNAIAAALEKVSNVVAVVLGGSYARGFARPDSDIDIGIYYRQASPCSVDEVRSVAERIASVGSVPIVTGLYEWGPWVNGGAWIQTPGGKVDILSGTLIRFKG
jgi:predicted nucleotidyltransferase